MRKKIAIVGSGISGLTAGFLLHPHHDITLFEAQERLGGHTATVDVSQQGKRYAVDTGFIVFNDRTYPLFFKLLARIGLKAKPTEMSFSIKSPDGLEYNGHNLDSLFAQRRNLFRPKFYRFIYEIVRFNRLALTWLEKNRHAVETPSLTLEDFLAQHEFSDYFSRHYILPMGAAIWSSTLADMRSFPLAFFLRFFDHHGLLTINDRPQWYVIPGGSREYIAPLTAGWQDKIRLSCAVTSITRADNGVHITHKLGEEHFDEVILACHSDQALALLNDASQEERNILQAMAYQANDVWLHLDERCLPSRRKAWASWNYQLTEDEKMRPLVSYNMNILQGLQSPEPFCVTLNGAGRIDENRVLERFVYHHPVFNEQTVQAQKLRAQICGQQHTHFCGAYWYNGFHEDGVKSAVDVARRFGGQL
ncbi:MAG: NAD(P)/FAD-dependent oxidoreductase [Vibrionaceae bacterium]